jgi:hypothetical protein
VSFAAITLCVASQQVFIVVVVYFVIDSVRKILNTSSYELLMIINDGYLGSVKYRIFLGWFIGPRE